MRKPDPGRSFLSGLQRYNTSNILQYTDLKAFNVRRRAETGISTENSHGFVCIREDLY